MQKLIFNLVKYFKKTSYAMPSCNFSAELIFLIHMFFGTFFGMQNVFGWFYGYLYIEQITLLC